MLLSLFLHYFLHFSFLFLHQFIFFFSYHSCIEISTQFQMGKCACDGIILSFVCKTRKSNICLFLYLGFYGSIYFYASFIPIISYFYISILYTFSFSLFFISFFFSFLPLSSTHYSILLCSFLLSSL